jgi:hypothetical protein
MHHILEEPDVQVFEDKLKNLDPHDLLVLSTYNERGYPQPNPILTSLFSAVMVSCESWFHYNPCRKACSMYSAQSLTVLLQMKDNEAAI